MSRPKCMLSSVGEAPSACPHSPGMHSSKRLHSSNKCRGRRAVKRIRRWYRCSAVHRCSAMQCALLNLHIVERINPGIALILPQFCRSCTPQQIATAAGGCSPRVMVPQHDTQLLRGKRQTCKVRASEPAQCPTVRSRTAGSARSFKAARALR